MIQYVPVVLQARIDQLERFIVEAGLELAAEAEVKAKVEAEEGEK